MAAYERLARYVNSAASREDAAAAAAADMRAAVDDLTRQAHGLDLIRVVSGVRINMVMQAALHGVEPAAAVLELIALALVCRDASGTTASADMQHYLPPKVQAAAQAAFEAGSMIALFEAPPTDVEANIVFRSVQREISLRNPVYPHMLLDTLRALFGNETVNEDCRAVLGFTGAEAVEVMEAVRTLANAALAERLARMEAARDASLPFLREWQRLGRPDAASQLEEHRAAAREVFEAVEDLTTNIDQATVIDVGAVAAQAGYERSTVEAVLDAFTLTGLSDIGEALERFFRGDNPLRTAPIVSDGQGRRMVVHDALALPAVREVIETRLKVGNRVEDYNDHRGKTVEKLALDLLAGVLPGAIVHRAFDYFVPDPKASTPQADPKRFTKRVEADGLILIDDVALIVEVKSVALTAEARGGVARRLRGKLRDIVTDAADQAGRLRERIITDRRIRVGDDDWIDVSAESAKSTRSRSHSKTSPVSLRRRPRWLPRVFSSPITSRGRCRCTTCASCASCSTARASYSSTCADAPILTSPASSWQSTSSTSTCCVSSAVCSWCPTRNSGQMRCLGRASRLSLSSGASPDSTPKSSTAEPGPSTPGTAHSWRPPRRRRTSRATTSTASSWLSSTTSPPPATTAGCRPRPSC